jgi:hemerythrin superfamily protein
MEEFSNLTRTETMPNKMDSVIAKGTGKVKGIKARLEGLGGVFKTLSQQHGEASALIDRIKRDAKVRAELWPTLRKELVSHERAEIREVYPELREHAETSALADHHDEEAGELDKLIQKLSSLDLASEQWGRLFEKLENMVVYHASEEEKEIFPKAQGVIGDEMTEKLDERFLATQKRIKESL